MPPPAPDAQPASHRGPPLPNALHTGHQHGNTEPSDDLPPYTGYHKMPVQIMKHTHQPRRTWRLVKHLRIGGVQPQHRPHRATLGIGLSGLRGGDHHWFARFEPNARSEEHTSELQSLLRISYDVF